MDLYCSYTPELEIRTEKCSDTCQYNIKFVLTFTKNDLTLVEIYAVALNFGLDTCQITLGYCTGQHQKWSENVRCPTVISCSDTLLFCISILIVLNNYGHIGLFFLAGKLA